MNSADHRDEASLRVLVADDGDLHIEPRSEGGLDVIIDLPAAG